MRIRASHENPSGQERPRSLWLSTAACSALMLAAGAFAPALAQVEAQVEADAESTAVTLPEQNTDGEEWLVDEERGRKYRVVKIPKPPEGQYRWLDDKRVRFRGGTWLEIVKHDDEHFWVKEYEMKNRTRTQAPKREAPPARDPAEVLASYESDLEEVDRIELEDFGQGLPRQGQWRNGFDLADMNGDGEIDILFGPARKGRPLPNIFLGDGEGGWRHWGEASFSRLPYDYGDAAAADFNGDGHMDAAFGIHLRGMVALLGDGEGGFTAWTEGIQVDHPGLGGDATSFSSRAIEAVDWNRDGRPDLLALGEGPKGQKTGPRGMNKGMINSSRGYVVYINNGDGTWQGTRPRAAENTSVRDFGDGYALGDFDRDGHLDLFTATRRMGNRSTLNLGKEGGALEAVPFEHLRPRAFLSAVDTADLNGDGASDLLISYVNAEGTWRTGVDIVLAGPEGAWERRTLFAFQGRNGHGALDAGDLDGDGLLDLAILTDDGRVRIYLGDGQGGFAEESSPELPQKAFPGCSGYHVRLQDLDGDGLAEIIATFAGESTGFPGIPDLNKPGCPGGGSIQAWSPASRG